MVHRLPLRPFLALACAALVPSISACSDGESGPVAVSVIGDGSDLANPLAALPRPGAKLMLETTAQGLVAFDAAGDILPALAQRWIVEDDGRSYIFRLRRAFWPDGRRVTATDVARLLKSRIAMLQRLDPHGPLDAVQSIVPMTGEVIELRLGAPRPLILQMLAQPQMGILSRAGGTGPYRATRRADALALEPTEPPPGFDDDEGAPAIPADQIRLLRAESAALAVIRFREGKSALVLGGRFSDLPLLIPAGIDKDMVRIDPVQGLFGLAFTGRNRLVDSDAVREAIAMSIDRDQIAATLPLGRWQTTDRLVPVQLDLPEPPLAPRWAGLPLLERQALGRSAVSTWRSENGDPPALRIALPAGPGSRLLFAHVARDLAAIGLAARQVAPGERAELSLIDEVAAYDSALWYMGRIGCARKIHCSAQADAQLKSMRYARTVAEVSAIMREALALMQAHNGYIPLGQPLRWSLAAPRLNGFAPSPRARHPLNHLFRSTN
ncbi:MAG: ABC transporter substrate-binding protein [Sphingobium sp.]